MHYECAGCRIQRTVCEQGGNPNGTVTIHSPSSEDYQEVLDAWTRVGGQFASADSCKKDHENCSVCTEDQ